MNSTSNECIAGTRILGSTASTPDGTDNTWLVTDRMVTQQSGGGQMERVTFRKENHGRGTNVLRGVMKLYCRLDIHLCCDKIWQKGCLRLLLTNVNLEKKLKGCNDSSNLCWQFLRCWAKTNLMQPVNVKYHFQSNSTHRILRRFCPIKHKPTQGSCFTRNANQAYTSVSGCWCPLSGAVQCLKGWDYRRYT